jgi:flagellar biosynthetic protein FlhB
MVAPEDDDESSKTEEPSERKISKAKEEGDVAISQDAKSFIMLLGSLFIVWAFLPVMCRWIGNIGRSFIERAGTTQVDKGNFIVLFEQGIFGFFKVMTVPFAVFMVLGVIASLSQTGFIYAPKKIEPDWNKLNIFAALTKFINKQKIVESIKGIIKIAAVSILAYWVLKPYLIKSELLPTMATYGILDFIHHVVVMLLFTVTIAVFVIAAGDYAWQKYSHLLKLRMTKQEVKEEYKQMEGDPLIKSKIRQIRMDRARQRMMENVPKADVVIVNPTHYAVALEYKINEMPAPKVTAKGVDTVALRIKAVAEENDIPIVENPPLARALFASTELDQTIPTEHFQAVAEVINYVMQLKRQ